MFFSILKFYSDRCIRQAAKVRCLKMHSFFHGNSSFFLFFFSGILDGTLTDFGAFEECLSVDTRLEQPDEINHFTGKYCILDIKPAFDADIPFGSQPPTGIKNDSVIWHQALQLFWSRNSLLSFRYGLCAPSLCSDQDLQVLAQYCMYAFVFDLFVNLFSRIR